MKKIIILSFLFIYSHSSWAYQCPPQFQDVCKNLILFLDAHKNDGLYQWDGTHLIIDGNFAAYDIVDNNPSTPNSWGGNLVSGNEYAHYTIWNNDFFPALAQKVISESQNGRQAYIHLIRLGNGGITGDLSNKPIIKGSKFHKNLQASQKVIELGSKNRIGNNPNMGKKAIDRGTKNRIINNPNAGKKGVALNSKGGKRSVIISLTKKVRNTPSTVSIQHTNDLYPNKKINRENINNHFVTPVPGNQITHNIRSYLIDSDNKVWSCKLSGLGSRVLKDHNNNKIVFGHIETLNFQSEHISNIPGNHEPKMNCLISVHK